MGGIAGVGLQPRPACYLLELIDLFWSFEEMERQLNVFRLLTGFGGFVLVGYFSAVICIHSPYLDKN